MRARLEETFAFDARDFGQPVTLAEVVTAIQQVTGVIAVDMISLARNATAVPAARAPRTANTAAVVQVAGRRAVKKAASKSNQRGVKGLTGAAQSGAQRLLSMPVVPVAASR